ncbi:MAG: hypothetical protein CMJ58_26930 [Planctomycetaceae bacterium]|nr:hypothetical protein [Planctomycetaceae bacterium]
MAMTSHVSPVSRVVVAVLIGAIATAPVAGQYSPGGPAPSPGIPSRPSPGIGGPRPQPSPGTGRSQRFPSAPTPNVAPSRPGQAPQPGRPPAGRPTTPSYRPDGPQSRQPGAPTGNRLTPGVGDAGPNDFLTPGGPRSRYVGPVMRNPLSVRQAPAFNARQAARAASSRFTGAAPGWQQMHELARTGNVAELRTRIDSRLRNDASLADLMSATSALDAAGVDAATTAPYRNRALEMARQQIQAGGNRPLPWIATAQLSLQAGDQQQFRVAAEELARRFPRTPEGHYFSGVQAIQEGDWKTAEASLVRAQQLGMDDPTLAEMLKLAIDQQKWVWQYAWIIAGTLVLWLAGFLVLYLAGRRLSAYTLRAVEGSKTQHDPGQDQNVRALYRIVLSLAAGYYYISLPLLLVAAIALPLALGYAVLMLPYLNLWLVAIILLGGAAGVITALSGLRTALTRIDYSLPGRMLKEDEAPQLWQLVRQVARRVGTRPVDVIQVTAQTEMAVTEQGSWLSRSGNRGRRVLIVGVGLLPGFNRDAFKSVLAHEYAHFLHRDTAGGDVALQVKIAMERFAHAIVARGPIRRTDLAVHYLRWFHHMFHRMALGASRLQEVLADRAAAEAYGASAFIAGLQHVIRRSIEFEQIVDDAVGAAIVRDVANANFYAPQKAIAPRDRSKIDARYYQELQQPTTEFDSHPGTRDRFAAARRTGVDQPLGTEAVLPLFGPIVNLLAKDMATELQLAIRRQAKEIRAADQRQLALISDAIRSQPAAELLEARAILYYRAGKYDQALGDLNRILQTLPDDVGALMHRAALYEDRGNGMAAARDLLKVRKLAASASLEQRAGLLRRLGDLLATLGKQPEAARMFDESLLLDKESLHGALGRLRVACALGQSSAKPMRALLQRVARQWPEEPALPELLAAAGMADAFTQARRQRKVRPPKAADSVEEPTSAAMQATLFAAGAAIVSAAVLVGYLAWDATAEPAGVAFNDIPAGSRPDAGSDDSSDAIPDADETPRARAPTRDDSSQPLSGDEQTAETSIPTDSSDVDQQPPGDGTGIEPDATERGGSDDEIDVSPGLDGDELPTADEGAGGDGEQKAEPEEPEEEDESFELAEREAAQEEASAILAAYRARRERLAPRKRMQPSQFVTIPAVRSPKISDQRVRPSNLDPVEEKLKTIALALMSYGEANRAYPVLPRANLLDRQGRPKLSWRVHLLRFLGEEELYKKFRRDEPWDSPHNLPLSQEMPAVYRSGVADNSKTCFVAVEGVHTLFSTGRPPQVRTGELRERNLTLLVVCVGANRAVPWTKPDQAEIDWENPTDYLGHLSNDGFYGVTADATVLRLPQRLPDDLFALLACNCRREMIDPHQLLRLSEHVAGRPLTVAKGVADLHMITMKRIVGAMRKYEQQRGALPTDVYPLNRRTSDAPLLSWRVEILPQLGFANLAAQFRRDEPWDSAHNLRLLPYMPDVYRDAAAAASETVTRVLTLNGPYATFGATADQQRPTTAGIRDGADHTALVVQAHPDLAVPWTQPADAWYDPANPAQSVGVISPRYGLVLGMANGEAYALPSSSSREALSALVSPAGRERIRLNFE